MQFLGFLGRFVGAASFTQYGNTSERVRVELKAV
jgi:hypothetical protein